MRKKYQLLIFIIYKYFSSYRLYTYELLFYSYSTSHLFKYCLVKLYISRFLFYTKLHFTILKIFQNVLKL